MVLGQHQVTWLEQTPPRLGSIELEPEPGRPGTWHWPMHSRLDKAASSAGHSLSHPARHQTPAAYSGVHVPADDNTSLPSPAQPSPVLLSRLMRRPVRASAPLAMSRILTAAFWMHQMHVNGQLLAACQVPESQNPARSGLGCSVCMYMHTVDTYIQRSQGEGDQGYQWWLPTPDVLMLASRLCVVEWRVLG